MKEFDDLPKRQPLLDHLTMVGMVILRRRFEEQHHAGNPPLLA